MSDGQQLDHGQDMSQSQSNPSQIDYSNQDPFSEDETNNKDQNQNNQNQDQNEDDYNVMQGDFQKHMNYQQTIFKINLDEPQHKIAKQQRMTMNCISKYEYATIIGMRANEISKNSPIYIQIQTYDNFNMLSPIQIAQLEYKEKKLPYTIIRPLPGGFYQQWDLSQLDDFNI